VTQATWRHPALARDGHHQLRPRGVDGLDARSLERKLRERLRGEVRFDSGHRALYAHDSSNYRQPPIGVVMPRDGNDVAAAIACCREHGAPVLPRGAGTGLAGETCNAAVVLDALRHMRRVLDVDPAARTARVEPGVTRDALCALTEARHGLVFGPDTSTHAVATLGGMIANDSCGMHSVVAGRTSDNVEELEVVTYDGLRLRVGPTSEDELERIVRAGGRRGEIYAGMRALRDRFAGAIRDRFPDIPRRVSGYNLDALLPENGFHVGRLLSGSAGTLATVLEARVRLVALPPARVLLVLGYPTIADAADAAPAAMEHAPLALEAMDERLVASVRAGREGRDEVPELPEGGGWLLAELGGDSAGEARERARECMAALERTSPRPACALFEDPAAAARVWRMREAGAGASSFPPGGGDRWTGWEDAAVPPGREGDYLRDFERLLERYGYRTALYGHFGQGCIHCRIDFDLRTEDGIARWRRFLDEAADLVVSYGGSLSGEHGDGQARAELLPKMFGDELTRAFGELKAIWDPAGRMNPHKVVDPYPIASNLRLGADFAPREPETRFAYPDDGGSFTHATLRCVGAGKCLDTESGTMCPSYMVTREEEHSTRGRARLLYELLEGETITGGFRSEEVCRALDLCLSCKGCKGECPAQVDMATLKAEFLSGYHRRRLRPRAAYSMGLIMVHARVAQRAPGLVNAALRSPGLGALLKRAGGISRARELPPFAERTFKARFKNRAPLNPDAPPVVLLADTFANFFEPAPLEAAVAVLEAAGLRPVAPEASLCCGRPLYDHGMLDTAKRLWRRNLELLRPYLHAGVPLVGIEPSCVAAFRDELPNLFPGDEAALRLASTTFTLGELLERHAPGWQPPRLRRRAVVHGHCHQEAIMGMSAEKRLLERIGLDYELLDSGCCGMAGAFGFERDHHDISVRIGERRLLPRVRDADAGTLVVADGFSCRTQIEQLAGRRALHTAEVVQMAIDHSRDGGPVRNQAADEARTGDAEETLPGGPIDHRVSRLPALLALGSMAVGAVLGARELLRRR
jgi:FAD/FMN-containing dehydrogenase/Fe-S oxidoreductase